MSEELGDEECTVHQVKNYDCIYEGKVIGIVRGGVPKLAAANSAFIKILEYLSHSEEKYKYGTEIQFSIKVCDNNNEETKDMEYKYIGYRALFDPPIAIPRKIVDANGNIVTSNVLYTWRNVVKRDKAVVQ